MNDINVVGLNLNQYYMIEHPELINFVDEDIDSATEVGACLEWKYDFNKCIEKDVPKLQELSIEFLLKFYGRDLLCYKVITSETFETILYMFFSDETSLSKSLIGNNSSYKDEIARDYKLFMREHKLEVFQLIFGEPQQFLGTTNRELIFGIIYFLLTFTIFKYVDSLVWRIGLLIALGSFIGIFEKLFAQKNK